MKLAAIDIGSNSVHLIIAEASGPSSFEVLDRAKEMVFLGRSVFEHGRLSEEAFERGLLAVKNLVKLAERHQVANIRAVATSATREADNGGEFLYAIAEATGIAPQVITGSEEARYIYQGVCSAVDLTAREALIVDIGGGSVELIVGNAEAMGFGASAKLGVQRLRAEFNQGGPLNKRQRRALVQRVHKEAGPTIRRARERRAKLMVGTSGTILALGQAASAAQTGAGYQHVSGTTVELDALSELTERLIGLLPSARASIPGVDAKRADTIHVGGLLLCTLMEIAGKKRITLCNAALREGLILDSIRQSFRTDIPYDTVSDIRRHSVLDLARRCGQSGRHPKRVAKLALKLFDETRELHNASQQDRRILEYGAILHDIGQLIGYERHEHHAAYIIRNGDLRGFTTKEREELALLARYHRKSRPKRRDPEFAQLGPKRRRVIELLAGMLRVADGLDRSHHQSVADLRCETKGKTLSIIAQVVGDAELEVWGAKRKLKLLARALRRELVLKTEPASGARQIA